MTTPQDLITRMSMFAQAMGDPLNQKAEFEALRRHVQDLEKGYRATNNALARIYRVRYRVGDWKIPKSLRKAIDD
jgi:hypothetical protein